MHIRVLVHALDRTGPPILALGFARWVASTNSDHTFDFVAFRGGPLLNDFSAIGPTRVLLDPMEPWDHHSPEPQRVEVARSRCAGVGPTDVTVAVSVSAAQSLPCLPRPLGPLATWSVEVGEDLHWVDNTTGLLDENDLWMAGSKATQDELAERLPVGTPIEFVPEFIPSTPDPDETVVANCRTSLDVDPAGLLVAGAGIATRRKGADLFIEAALESMRRHGSRDRFVWIGGERDQSFFRFRDEALRIGATNVRFLGNVVDVEPWIAAADVLLHTARLDSFPLVCLHAASVRTPTIGFDGVGGLREMFEETTIAAPFPDIVGVVDLLDGLRSEPDRVDAGAAQYQHITGRFTAASAAGAVLDELERLVNRPDPAYATGHL